MAGFKERHIPRQQLMHDKALGGLTCCDRTAERLRKQAGPWMSHSKPGVANFGEFDVDQGYAVIITGPERHRLQIEDTPEGCKSRWNMSTMQNRQSAPLLLCI